MLPLSNLIGYNLLKPLARQRLQRTIFPEQEGEKRGKKRSVSGRARPFRERH